MPDGLAGSGRGRPARQRPRQPRVCCSPARARSATTRRPQLMGYLDASTARVLRAADGVHPDGPELAHDAHAVRRRRRPTNIAKGSRRRSATPTARSRRTCTPADPTRVPDPRRELPHRRRRTRRRRPRPTTLQEPADRSPSATGQKPAVLPPGYAPLPADLADGDDHRRGAAGHRRRIRRRPPPRRRPRPVGRALGERFVRRAAASRWLVNGSVPLRDVGAAHRRRRAKQRGREGRSRRRRRTTRRPATSCRATRRGGSCSR